MRRLTLARLARFLVGVLGLALISDHRAPTGGVFPLATRQKRLEPARRERGSPPTNPTGSSPPRRRRSRPGATPNEDATFSYGDSLPTSPRRSSDPSCACATPVSACGYCRCDAAILATSVEREEHHRHTPQIGPPMMPTRRRRMSATAGKIIAAAIASTSPRVTTWRIQATIATVIPNACNTTNDTACCLSASSAVIPTAVRKTAALPIIPTIIASTSSRKWRGKEASPRACPSFTDASEFPACTCAATADVEAPETRLADRGASTRPPGEDVRHAPHRSSVYDTCVETLALEALPGGAPRTPDACAARCSPVAREARRLARGRAVRTALRCLAQLAPGNCAHGSFGFLSDLHIGEHRGGLVCGEPVLHTSRGRKPWNPELSSRGRGHRRRLSLECAASAGATRCIRAPGSTATAAACFRRARGAAPVPPGARGRTYERKGVSGRERPEATQAPRAG